MAGIIWAEPALSDLDAIADYISLDNPQAARELVRRVFDHVGRLAEHPLGGPKVPELKGWRYRQIVEPPCRVIYRRDKEVVYILHVVRGERLLRKRTVRTRGKRVPKK